MQDFEKLGVFYLGRGYDLDAGKAADDLLLYDAKDLTTHAVCVGMTGSGKTGLCLALLEEAAIDGIPAIAIDPKGDLGNLLLTFPELRPERLSALDRPGRGRRARASRPSELAAQTAETLEAGAGRVGPGRRRGSQRFRDAVDIAIYTPGSSAGLAADGAALVRRAAGQPCSTTPTRCANAITAAVVGLARRCWASTPIRSAAASTFCCRTFSTRAWRDGRRPRPGRADPRDPDAAVRQGRRDRPGELLPGQGSLRRWRCSSTTCSPRPASPPGWKGEPLDVQRLLYTPEGKPRLSILSIAHLSDAERMFFVTILLNEVIAWMRTPAGHVEPAGDPLHGRGLRLLPADGQSAVEDADADAAQAGPGVRPGRGAGDAEPGRSRLQGALERRHVVPRPAADRARQGPRARRPGRRLGRGRGDVRPRRRWRRSSPAWATASS